PRLRPGPRARLETRPRLLARLDRCPRAPCEKWSFIVSVSSSRNGGSEMSSVATGIRGPCRGVVSLATNRRALDSPPRTKSRVGVRTRWNGGSGIQRRDPPPQVVEGDAVIERGRLDNELV